MRRPDGRMDGRRRRGCWATEILGIRSGRVDGQAEGPAPGRRGAGPSARARGRQYIVVWRWPSAEKPDAETDAPTPAETATSPAATCSPREPGAAGRARGEVGEFGGLHLGSEVHGARFPSLRHFATAEAKHAGDGAASRRGAGARLPVTGVHACEGRVTAGGGFFTAPGARPGCARRAARHPG